MELGAQSTILDPAVRIGGLSELDLTDLVSQVAVPPRPDLVTIVPASQEVYRAAPREGPLAGDRPGSILTTKEKIR